MKVYLEVYGCTANKSDATIIKGCIHHDTPFTFTDSLDLADLVILVTCTVIGTTEQRMIHRLRIFKKLGKKVVVTGCMASVQVEKIQAILPHAIIVPPNNVHMIVSAIDSSLKQIEYLEKPHAPKFFDSLIAPISISEGCQYNCTYCITHLARGKLQSYPENMLLQDVRTAIQQGCKEIQLTAQDTASYGRDSESSLPQLLSRLCSLQGQYRYRIGMMNPRSLKDHIRDIIKIYSYEQVYRFIHLPVQSGDDEILQLMQRGYTSEEYRRCLSQIRKNIADISLATDIIVGFPSETEEQFQHSIDLLTSIKPDIVNITRYSARPQTKAKAMKDRIPTDIVKDRSKRLTTLIQQISLARNQAYIGQEVRVLTIEKGKNSTIVGRTKNYKPVVLKEEVDLGIFTEVTIVDAKETYLVGTLK